MAALAVGALAALALRGYVGGVEDRANRGAERVRVLRIDTDIARGAFGQEASASISVDEIPREFFPANAVDDLSRIDNLVAVTDLAANQILVDGMFVTPDVGQISSAERLDQVRGQDMTALTISVDEVRGVAGLIVPGDQVNILVTQVGEAGEGAPAGTAAASVFDQQARYLYQKVRVLYVDQNPVPQPGEVQQAAAGAPAPPAPANKGLLTLLVPADAAQRIASVEPGRLYLTLVADDYEPVPMIPIDPAAPLPGEDPARLTPYGPDGPE
ncbi:hypothetical protein BH20ACT2_BH20ACT2_22740 [soil metagenome]